MLSGPTYASGSAEADGGVLEAVLDFIADMFKDMLFGLFEILFGIFSLSILANRPLFAAPREKKPTQKVLSTKAEIKPKQLLIVFSDVYDGSCHRSIRSFGCIWKLATAGILLFLSGRV